MRFRFDRFVLLAAVSCSPLFSPLAFSAPPPTVKSQQADFLTDQVTIPGPLRSFLRMAGISQEVAPEDVLPTLARDVHVLGAPAGKPTEYLLLLQRYVQQERELQSLAASDGNLRVLRCEDSGPLLQVLGYRLRNPCGAPDATLVASNPDRAFLTINSGFPLTQLEEALQEKREFTYSCVPTRVPVLFRQGDWTNLSLWRKPAHADLLDVLLNDPNVARLYWAISRVDPETRLALKQSPGLGSLLPSAAEMDFYGSQLCIRSKRVLVPGGTAAEPAWKELVGASPGSPGEFVPRLLSQDRGWLAAYFDTLARLSQAQQQHFTGDQRLKRLYAAFREPDREAYAARATFRKAPLLLVLLTRQRWLDNGEPAIPGSLDLWKQILGEHARNWNSSEQVLEAMAFSSRLDLDKNPLSIYLVLSELEDVRTPGRSLSPATMLLLAHSYLQFGDWYPVFSEFPGLNDDSIGKFIHAAERLDKISNDQLRGDSLGMLQANLGLWQILARQGEIPEEQLNASWQKCIDSFAKIGSAGELFDAGAQSLGGLMLAASGKSERTQGEIVDLLASPPQKTPQGEEIRVEVASRMLSVMEDQRLTSVDTLFELSRGLRAMEQGTPPSKQLIALAGELREFEMPRRIFTENEKAQWAPGVFQQHHTLSQVRTDLTKAIEQPGPPAKLEIARGQLASFLRDTLVGLNYAYYEPPGSQILHINPLFVRSHDFAGTTVTGVDHVWQASTLFGRGAPAGGGAYLLGSLADLPYVLAEAEQNYIVPKNVQALIWQEIVPDLLAGATLTRWWNVGPHELHAVALYQRSGEELLAGSAGNQQLREEVLAILANRMSPLQMAQVEQAMQSKAVAAEIPRLLPADTFYLAAEFRQRYPNDTASFGAAGQALDGLSLQYPPETNLGRISKDFGIPHPAMAQTYGREMLNVKPFPAFSGYSSRLFGESWDSSNLYWARLADENSDSPADLNVLSPQLTRVMVSRIFASHFEDWPAVVRAMHLAGDDFQRGKLALLPQAETGAPASSR